jgi:DNA-binding transcriptional ArsR family regulator
MVRSPRPPGPDAPTASAGLPGPSTRAEPAHRRSPAIPMVYRLVMTERSDQRVAGGELDADGRRFAEEFGLLGETMGMPRMNGRLLGWMLICDPPRQSLGDIARNLGVSRASVSTATRLLRANGLLRRAAEPGRRAYAFELEPGVFEQLPADVMFGALRRQLERGLAILGDETDPRAARLREARDFYAFVEREIPLLIDRYRASRRSAERAPRDEVVLR